jgi:NAD-dependent SIR2 family protein deacetylase
VARAEREGIAVNADIQRAAELIRSADAVLIGAGAGMGVDSGLPDFRGDEGFWKAYPPFRGQSFADISNPYWFEADPRKAWGFFGHRLHLYRNCQPHDGFGRLRRWADQTRRGYFVFTSNVDGQFQKAGFPADKVLERHGSIHHLQCARPCGMHLWPANEIAIEIDADTFRATSELPHCQRCGGVARPNILMFGDGHWSRERYDEQRCAYYRWLEQMRSYRIIAIEMGAGLAVPTVREESERRAAAVIRINPRDDDPPRRGIALALGARAGLAAIDEVLQS